MPGLDTAAAFAAEPVDSLPADGLIPDLDLRPEWIAVRLPQQRHKLATTAAALVFYYFGVKLSD